MDTRENHIRSTTQVEQLIVDFDFFRAYTFVWLCTWSIVSCGSPCSFSQHADADADDAGDDDDDDVVNNKDAGHSRTHVKRLRDLFRETRRPEGLFGEDYEGRPPHRVFRGAQGENNCK